MVKESENKDSYRISFVMRDFLSNFAPKIITQLYLWHYNAVS